MCRNKMVYWGCFLVFLIMVWVLAFNLNKLATLDENIEIDNSTMMSIVYADSDVIELSEVKADVCFDEVLIDNLETSISSALMKSGEDFLDESLEKQEKAIKEAEEKVKKEEELKKYYASVSNSIIKEKDGAVFTYNPYIKSNLSVEQYNKILAGTGLAGCGESYYRMEQEYNVNGLFALSVACLESGYGKHKANTNNFYGMRSSKGWMAFESPDANIQYFGKLMNKSLYKGKDILGIGATYCPGTHVDWANKVKSIMSNSFNKL